MKLLNESDGAAVLDDRSPVVIGDDTPFARYIMQIANGYCPYLEPAQRASALFSGEYIVPAQVADDSNALGACVFYQVVRHTEWLRHQRRAASHPRAALLCDNVIITLDANLIVDWKKVLAWPHFAAKLLYSDLGLMFGKFWIGEESVSRVGRPIPSPTVSFISIRSAFPTPDALLLSRRTPEFIPRIQNGIDDGRSVLGEFGIDAGIPDLCTLIAANLYERVLEQARAFLSRPHHAS